MTLAAGLKLFGVLPYLPWFGTMNSRGLNNACHGLKPNTPAVTAYVFPRCEDLNLSKNLPVLSLAAHYHSNEVRSWWSCAMHLQLLNGVLLCYSFRLAAVRDSYMIHVRNHQPSLAITITNWIICLVCCVNMFYVPNHVWMYVDDKLFIPLCPYYVWLEFQNNI